MIRLQGEFVKTLTKGKLDDWERAETKNKGGVVRNNAEALLRYAAGPELDTKKLLRGSFFESIIH
ncbi:MAG: hypothetical protein AB7E30_10725 [Lawsonibacter sp.]